MDKQTFLNNYYTDRKKYPLSKMGSGGQQI